MRRVPKAPRVHHAEVACLTPGLVAATLASRIDIDDGAGGGAVSGPLEVRVRCLDGDPDGALVRMLDVAQDGPGARGPLPA